MPYSNNPNPPPKNHHKVIIGNSIDIHIDPSYAESEIRADVTVSQFTSVRLWGRIVNCQNEPLANALVKLVRIIDKDGGCNYQGISHTTSDADGFYQFDICADERGWYKVLVGKSTTGKEIIVSENYSSCNPIETTNYYQTNEDPEHFNNYMNQPNI